MKRGPLINSEMSRAIAELGHRDWLVLADAGHAIPRDADRIDIALRPGLPAMVDVLETVLTEMRAEAFVVCDQISEENPSLSAEFDRLLPGVERIDVSYSRFREIVGSAKTVVRTGEATAQANIILRATGTV